MKFKKTLATLIALVAITTGGLVAGYSSPAEAAYNNCQVERVCLYENSNGGGYVYVGRYNLKNCNNLPEGFNDITTSVWNRAPYSGVTIFSGYNCVGNSRYIAPGRKIDWSGFLGSFNDTASSYRWNP